MSQSIVHVVGTGTIGEPLIGLLAHFRRELHIDEVTFYKHTPRLIDRPKMEQLVRRGARLAAADDKAAEIRTLGVEVAYEAEEAIKRATVVIDCTPKGTGNNNKKALYLK